MNHFLSQKDICTADDELDKLYDHYGISRDMDVPTVHNAIMSSSWNGNASILNFMNIGDKWTKNQDKFREDTVVNNIKSN